MSTYHLPGRAIPATLRGGVELPRVRKSPAKALRSLHMFAVLALKTYQVALQPSHEVTSSEKPAEGGTPREGPEARWRAIDRIKHQIREEKGVFDREARIKALEEFKRAATATSWSVRGCLYRIIQALLRYLNLFALLLSRLFFFEFPNNLRHLCTTMPWSIWPALVVLWGVCWMFYENTDRHIAPQELETPQLESPLPLGPPPSCAWPVFFFGVPTPPPTVGVDPVRDIDWSDVLDYSTPAPFHMFDWARGPLVSSGEPGSPSQQTLGGFWHTTSPRVNTFGKSTFESDAMDQQPLHELGQDPETRLAPCDLTALENFVTASSIELNMIPQTAQTSLNVPSSLTMGTPPTSPAASNRHTSPSSMVGPVGLKCGEPGCKSRTFKSVNEITKHRARHDRRFACGACTRRFGTKNDLDRHRATVHGQGAAGLYCDVPGCKRRARAFSRKDNFAKHLRDVHGRVDNPTRVASVALTGNGGGVEDAARRDGTELRDECECGVLRREKDELRRELDTLRRGIEAEGSRQREELMACREREARLWRLLERAMSRDNIEMASQQV